jgi:hypothetical protein
MSYLEGENVACAVISFDRPGYLKKTLDGLNNAEGSEHVDFHLFQDGAKDRFGADKMWGSADGVQQSIDVAQKHELDFEELHIFEENHDILLMTYFAQGLFRDYDSVLFMENDLFVGGNYIQNVFSAHKQFPRASVTMYRADSTPSPKTWVQKFIHIRLWGYMFGQTVWGKIRDRWSEIVDMFRGIRYRGNREEQLSKQKMDRIETLCGSRSHCADIILSSLIIQLGLSKIRPVTTRAKYIGKHGHHAYSEDYWQEKDMDDKPVSIEHEIDPVKQWAISGNKRSKVSRLSDLRG